MTTCTCSTRQIDGRDGELIHAHGCGVHLEPLDTLHPCGPDSRCMVVFGGKVAHDDTWHRLHDVRELMAEWWEHERCCDSDWCSTGNVDTRLGRVLGVLGIIDPLDAR